jgi:hypothetical protein
MIPEPIKCWAMSLSRVGFHTIRYRVYLWHRYRNIGIKVYDLSCLRWKDNLITTLGNDITCALSNYSTCYGMNCIGVDFHVITILILGIVKCYKSAYDTRHLYITSMIYIA